MSEIRRGLRVLLVEDDLDDAELLEHALTVAGFAPAVHRVETAVEMRRSLLCACGAPFDVIVSDCHMPEFSAEGALETLRESGMDIPLVVVSGIARVERMVGLMRAGAKDVIEKGDLSRLGPAIRRELVEAESRRQARFSEEMLRRESTHDALTGLPNRVLLLDRLNQAVAQGHRRSSLNAVLHVNVDGFRSVNDAGGREAGDLLLRELARRILGCIREGDTLSRVSGDEFVAVLTELTDHLEIRGIAERVLEVVAEPFELPGGVLLVTARIGISTFPPDASDGETLLRQADLAMRKAKEQGRGTLLFYTSAINEELRRRVELENRLRGAAARDELELEYQPQYAVSAKEGAVPRLIGIEALVRWRPPPDLDLVPPGDFIPLAEEIGLIGEIGEWVVATACRDAARLFAGRDPDLRVAVNVSPNQLRRPGFAEMVVRELETSGLPPNQLELEITEGVAMDVAEDVSEILRSLCARGVRLSIDDFGTGYSSLGYLQRYPFDILKIDRSFVTKSATDPRQAKLVEGMVSLAHGLGLKVVAEGVETLDQLEFLARIGCDLVQGWLLGRSMSVEGIAARLCPRDAFA
jgi:diguanylate cyclase (GGDEF)-like protein